MSLVRKYIFVNILWRYWGASKDYVLENRLKYVISKEFRILQDLPDESLYPLSDDEKYSINRFYKSFIKKENISDAELNQATEDRLLDHLKALLKGMNKEQVQKFISMKKSSTTKSPDYKFTESKNVTQPHRIVSSTIKPPDHKAVEPNSATQSPHSVVSTIKPQDHKTTESKKVHPTLYDVVSNTLISSQKNATNETEDKNKISELQTVTQSLNTSIPVNKTFLNVSTNIYQAGVNESDDGNITNIKKSEIFDPGSDSIEPYFFDTFVDELVDNVQPNIYELEKRKEIYRDPNDMKSLDLSEMIHSNRANEVMDQIIGLNNETQRKHISEELFNMLAKEGWNEYQKLSQHEKEDIDEVKPQNTNYMHWNFENYQSRKVLGSPGNPLTANGNLLFNKGSLTFLENSDGYLNGGDYKDACISDPLKCIDGFSIQITFKTNEFASTKHDNQYFLVDTGASSPDSRGFSIFLMENETLGFHVADGTHNWCATKSLQKQLLNKWVSLILIFNQIEGLTIITNCKDMLESVSYERCTPCLDCHKTDLKTTLTIGRPNNLNIDYPSLPMIISDLEIYYYPLNSTKLFEKCGIVTDTSPRKKATINKLYSKYPTTYNGPKNTPFNKENMQSLINPYISPATTGFNYFMRAIPLSEQYKYYEPFNLF